MHWKLLFRTRRRIWWTLLPLHIVYGWENPPLSFVKCRKCHLKKIGLGHKNYNLTNLYHFFKQTLKFRFLSQCWIWGLHTIFHKHHDTLKYFESTWHHTQRLQSSLSSLKINCFIKTRRLWLSVITHVSGSVLYYFLNIHSTLFNRIHLFCWFILANNFQLGNNAFQRKGYGLSIEHDSIQTQEFNFKKDN